MISALSSEEREKERGEGEGESEKEGDERMREGRARKGYRNKISVAAQCADALSSLKALYKVTLKRPSCHLLVHGRWMTDC